MNEVAQLTELIKNKANLVAMLAPSFPIVYQYPQIVTRLKKLGFTYVVEVAVGAKKTNETVVSLLINNPTGRFITSPCASFVRYIRTKHPDLIPYLAFQADSPMIATTKIVAEKYPGYQPVFIGPCIVKKREASEDYPQLNIVVITYKELDELFTQFNISQVNESTTDKFDLSETTTRIYPFDGGLTFTSGVRTILKDEEIRIVSNWKNIDIVLEEFKNNSTIRFVDVLFCDGGCINGPGIVSPLSTEERKQRIIQFQTSPTLISELSE